VARVADGIAHDGKVELILNMLKAQALGADKTDEIGHRLVGDGSGDRGGELTCPAIVVNGDRFRFFLQVAFDFCGADHLFSLPDYGKT